MKPDPLTPSLKPVYYLCRLIGLAPFSLHGSLRPTTLSCCYSVTLALVFIVGVARTTSHMARVSAVGEFSLAVYVTLILLMIFGGNCAVVSLVAAVSKSNHLDVMVRKLSAVDGALNKRRPAWQEASRRVLAETAALVVWLTGLLAGNMYFYSWAFVEYIVFRYLMDMISYMNAVMMVNAAVMLKRRWAIINGRIGRILGGERSLRHDDRIEIKWRGKLLLKTFVSSVYGTNVEKPSVERTTADIRCLRRSYGELQLVTHAINSYFGLRMIGLFAYLLVSITTFTFMLISATIYFEYIHLSPIRIYEIVANVCSLFANVFVLVAIATSCHMTSQEASRSSLLVQQCLLVDNISSEVRQELKEFSYQLTNNKPVFTACGVFNVDTTLLLSVAASVTSYSIILLTLQ